MSALANLLNDNVVAALLLGAFLGAVFGSCVTALAVGMLNERRRSSVPVNADRTSTTSNDHQDEQHHGADRVVSLSQYRASGGR